MHTDSDTKIDLATGKDGLALQATFDADAERNPASNDERFLDILLSAQVGAVQHVDERFHAAGRFYGGAPPGATLLGSVALNPLFVLLGIGASLRCNGSFLSRQAHVLFDSIPHT